LVNIITEPFCHISINITFATPHFAIAAMLIISPLFQPWPPLRHERMLMLFRRHDTLSLHFYAAPPH